MKSDRPDEAAMPEWKRKAKERLRTLVAPSEYGSQRQLAKAWLGTEAKASQVSEWCSVSNPKFPETASLYRLRQTCGVSIDWLLGDGASPTKDWSNERREKLSHELEAFCEHAAQRRIKAFGAKHAEWNATEWDAVARGQVRVAARGDFLRYVERQVDVLANRACLGLLRYFMPQIVRKWQLRAQRAEEQLLHSGRK